MVFPECTGGKRCPWESYCIVVFKSAFMLLVVTSVISFFHSIDDVELTTYDFSTDAEIYNGIDCVSVILSNQKYCNNVARNLSSEKNCSSEQDVVDMAHNNPVVYRSIWFAGVMCFGAVICAMTHDISLIYGNWCERTPPCQFFPPPPPDYEAFLPCFEWTHKILVLLNHLDRSLQAQCERLESFR